MSGATQVCADNAAPCERKWTFPVPFYQSVTFSPDGSRIAVSAVTTSWDDGYRIFIANADATGMTLLETGGESDLYPAWSPDGSRIAFSSKREGNSDIYTIKVGGTDVTRLTRHDAKDSCPSWSPDGSSITFHSNRDGNYEIYRMKADGSEKVRLTSTDADDYNPVWSPDGERIAFESNRDEVEGDEIYLISPDGTGLVQIVGNGVFPMWSRDSKQILYASKGLYVVNADGSGATRLLENAVCGAWSPVGPTITAAAYEFDENCKDHHALVALNADGSGKKKLLPRE